MYFTVHFRTLTNDTLVHFCISSNILWCKDITLGIDFPVFFIQIKLRNQIDELHISFPVRTKGSYIFPVSVVFVCKNTLPLIKAVWDHMHTKVTVLHILVCNERFFQCFPAENINSHGRKIALWLCRFLLELTNTVLLIGHYDTKTACLLHRHRHNCDGNIRIVLLMEIKHHFIVHLIDMVSGQDQYIFRIVTVYVFHILINSIRCTGIPFTSATFLIWLQNRNTTVITIQIPRNTNTDMRI